MKFPIIYLDPPWEYKDKSHAGKRGSIYKYPSMSDEELASLPISDIAADQSVILCWATAPKLPVAIKLIAAWGFKYKTIGFVWVKTNRRAGTPFMGMGSYTRANAEFVLLGVRGKATKLVKNHSVHQIIQSPIREHSQKPEEVPIEIVKLFGDLPRVELFARSQREGWMVCGNEIAGKTINEELRELSLLLG